MSVSLVKASPQEWLADIKAAIEDPQTLRYASGVVPGGGVIPLAMTDAFNTFHVRAIAHATTRGEHEALMYLSFYVIHKYKLYIAYGNGTWEGYCDDIDSSPVGVSKSSIKQKVKDIQDLLDKNTTIENIVMLMAIAPMSARAIADVPPERLPDGGINAAASTIIELGPAEGRRYVSDISGSPTVKCIGHRYDEDKEILLLKLRTNDRENEKTYDTDLVINDIGEIEAVWLIVRLGRQSK